MGNPILIERSDDMKYYCLGIKGTGMSTLAQILSDLGNEVSGYDDAKDYKFTQDGLDKRNIKIRPGIIFLFLRRLPDRAGRYRHCSMGMSFHGYCTKGRSQFWYRAHHQRYHHPADRPCYERKNRLRNHSGCLVGWQLCGLDQLF